MAYTITTHLSLIYKTFTDYDYVFENGSPLYVKQVPSFNNRINLYIPEALSFGENGNLRTKNGGYLSARETLDITDPNSVKLLSYSYKYTIPSHIYECADAHSNSKIMEFSFRYEKEPIERPGHPKQHLHVIHEKPRFYADSCTFNKVVKIIADNFYKDKIVSNIPLW